MKTLLENAKKFNLVNTNGSQENQETLMEFMHEHFLKDSHKILELLIQYGAKKYINSKVKNGDCVIKPIVILVLSNVLESVRIEVFNMLN